MRFWGIQPTDYRWDVGHNLSIQRRDHATPYTNLLLHNNILPAAQLSQQALNVLKMLPTPYDPKQLVPFNNFSKNTEGTVNTSEYTTRVDHQLTSRIHTFGRYTYYRRTNYLAHRCLEL